MDRPTSKTGLPDDSNGHGPEHLRELIAQAKGRIARSRALVAEIERRQSLERNSCGNNPAAAGAWAIWDISTNKRGAAAR